MKKILILFLLLSQFAFAQNVKVLSVEKVAGTENGGYYYPVISPNNDYLLLTKANYQGLSKFTFDNKKIEVLNDDLGAGYDAKISADGSKVLYNKVTLVNKRRHNSLVTQNVIDKNKNVIEAPSRSKISADIINDRPVYVKDGKMIAERSATRSASDNYIITIEDRKMVLYRNGQKTTLTPNGANESYIWPSISPDKKNLVYTVAGKGTFVSTIDGGSPIALGNLRAPKWVNNNLIVGMNDIDDGEKLISSQLVVSSKDAKMRKNLETPQVNAMYPAPSADGKKIAFNSEEGQVYIMNVEIQ